MLVHFIGGPAHGRSEAIKDPHPVWRMAELKRLPMFAKLEYEGDFAAATVPYIEHEYKITRRTARYAIAEWQAPLVDVRFQVRLEIDPFDDEAVAAFSRFFMERRTEEKHGVRCVGASMSSAWESELELVTRVEGPEDAVALQLAGEKVQHYLDSELPPCKRYVVQAAATT